MHSLQQQLTKSQSLLHAGRSSPNVFWGGTTHFQRESQFRILVWFLPGWDLERKVCLCPFGSTDKQGISHSRSHDTGSREHYKTFGEIELGV